MPKIFELNGYKFFFFSNEGIPREPCHIHVRKGEQLAKFWIDPAVRLDFSWGINPGELNRLEEIIEQHEEMIRRKWDEYFSS